MKKEIIINCLYVFTYITSCFIFINGLLTFLFNVINWSSTMNFIEKLLVSTTFLLVAIFIHANYTEEK